MKKRYIVLISILGVFLLFGGFIVGLFIGGTCTYKYSNTNDSLSNWMKYIKDDTKINSIIIPGSHDSGTYDMLYAGETQTFTIKQQLNVGVRYLDLRVTNNDGNYVFFHSIINGVEVLPAILDIKSFLEANPSECLILDFQHFQNGARSYVLNIIDEYLLPYAVKNESSMSDLAFIDSLTLSDARGKCIILFGDGKENTNLNYIFYRNNDECTKSNACLDSFYKREYNASPSLTYIEKYIPLAIEKIKEKEATSYKGLFVLQCQLTEAKYIFGPYSRERQHEENISSYITSLRLNDDFSVINIIMRDFITQEKTEEIIKQNYYKDIIKNELEEEFMNNYKVA